MRARIAGFSMVVSSSDFIGGCEEFARPHRRQALGAGWIGRRPARAEKAGFGDAGDGNGFGLVAAQHVEMRVVLADCEADMAAGTALKDQHGADDGLHHLPEQQPVARPIGIGAQCPEQRFLR